MDVKRTTDRKLGRLLILANQEEKQRVLAAYPPLPEDNLMTDTPPSSPSTLPQSTPSIVAQSFPAQDIHKSISLYLPNFEYGALFPTYQKIAGHIMTEKAKRDEELVPRMMMSKRLADAYNEAITAESTGDMEACE